MRNLPPYSFLYYKQLLSLFRMCGLVKTISFESSRAYVEFSRHPQDSGVLPDVFLALLMAQQSPTMELSVYPIDQIETRAGNRNITHLKHGRIIVDVQSQKVSPVGLISGENNPDTLPPKLLFVVKITEVMEVGHFWGFRADEASLRKQRQMTADINSRTLQHVARSLYSNLLCLAPYSDVNDQSMYYRAKILHIRGTTVEVFFLDFGNTAVVPSSSLRELPSDLLSEPFQAQEFHIMGMRPSAKSIILGNRWSSRSRDRFVALVKGNTHMVSLYSILHGVMRIELLINSDKLDTSVRDILVEEGHAEKVEESFESKQNHDELMSLYKDMNAGTHVCNTTSSSWKNRKIEEEELIKSLLKHFSNSCQPFAKDKAHLQGPYSPHRISFHSLNRKIFYKTVTVERSSMNSLAVNENPHCKHQRMLVAGNVAVSPTGTRILLRDTTLMPDIPGLPALITMLFTPVMELRTDKERTCYTGALCGLGWNSRTQKAIFPEHDIELVFDVQFDVEDIIEINELRQAVNRMMCEGTNGTLRLVPGRVAQLQDDCRERLISLFSKNPARNAIPPVYYTQAEKWNQVNPSLTMDHVPPDPEKTRGVLFQLHPVTLLNT